MTEHPATGNETEEQAPLRVLVIDKVAVVEEIRDRYNRLVERSNIDMTLLVPSVWIENSAVVPYRPVAGERFRTVVGKSSWPGHEIKSAYYSGLIRAFRASQPEVILMLEEAFSFFALQTVFLRKLLAPRAPIIFYSSLITTWDESVYRPKRFFRDLGRAILKRTEGAICLNDRATAMLHDAGFDKARTLFFGVDERGFIPAGPDAARRELGLDAETTIFMFAGRLLVYKGVDDLIDAYSAIRLKHPGRPMKLLVAGTGPHASALHEHVESLGLSGEIEFLGAVPIARMPLYMNAIDALVLPSRAFWNEQFGRVLVEAMLSETPVIGSTSGEIPTVIGEDGYIFTADDVDALQRTMQQVLDDPEEARARARRGRIRALREFSTGAFVDGLVDLLEDYSGRSLRTGREVG